MANILTSPYSSTPKTCRYFFDFLDYPPSNLHRLAHILHGQLGLGPGLPGPSLQDIVQSLAPLPLDLPTPLPGRLENRFDLPGQDLLAVDATDGSETTVAVDRCHRLRGGKDLVQGEDRALLGAPRVAAALSLGVGHHGAELLPHGLFGVREEDRIAVALAHLAPVEPGKLGGFGEKGERFGEDIAVEAMEPADDLPGELEMRDLVLPHGNMGGTVEDDVGRLEDRVAQEAVLGQIAVFDLGHLILVGGISEKPGHRGHHPQEKIELGMGLHVGLLEKDTLLGIEAGREEVQKKLPDIVPKGVGLLVVRGQRMPVGNEEKAVVPILELYPVSEGPHVVAQVQPSGGLDAAHDPSHGNLRLVFHSLSLRCWGQ